MVRDELKDAIYEATQIPPGYMPGVVGATVAFVERWLMEKAVYHDGPDAPAKPMRPLVEVAREWVQEMNE